MTCDDVRPLLGAYADGELDATQAVAVGAHLTTCKACNAIVNADAAVGGAVRDAWPRAEVPDLLAARVKAAIAADAGAERAAVVREPSRAARYGARAAAALLLVAAGSVGTLLVTRAGGGDADAGAMVARQVAALMANRSIAVVSSEHHTVKPWFAGRVEFSPPVPTLDSIGVTLSGARVDTVDGRRAAVLEYRKRAHVIGVFVTYDPAGRAGDGIESAEARGYHVLRWRAADLAFAAVSDINAEELRGFVEAFRQSK